MKKLFTIVAILVLSATAFSQAPQKMSYQAVIRDAGNLLVTNQSIGMQISILQGGSSGTSVYIETQSPTTNINGLVSLEIGTGTVLMGDFSSIDWSIDSYFIKTETDPTGGTNYTITGTMQLLSVPYALHANVADSIVGGINITETDPFFGLSLASNITSMDTANWNNHTIDTDTHLDSTDIAGLGYVAESHTIDTDTHLDSIGIVSLGFIGGTHTLDTDTHLDSVGIAGLGYVAGLHTIDTDTQLDSVGVVSLGFVADAHTVDTDTHLDSTGIAGLGFVAGMHTDTHLDSMDIANLGYVAGGITTEIDGSVTNEIQNLSVSLTGDTLSINSGNYVIIPGISAANPIQIGDFKYGGIIFYIDGTGQHGLVCAVSDLPANKWSLTSNLMGNTAAGIGTGQTNTTNIILDQGIGSYAAQNCNDLSSNGYSDWFLPSRDELTAMYTNKTIIDITALLQGGSVFSNNYYWSSTELDVIRAWALHLNSGGFFTTYKIGNLFNIRAVRAF